MIVSLAAVLVAADIPMPVDAPQASQQLSSICVSGSPQDIVEVRVFPINIVRLVWPSTQEIMAKGVSNFMTRDFWQGAMGTICDPNLPDADVSLGEFLPRIVVYVNGEESREPILLEYPHWSDNPAPVRGRLNGRLVEVPAAIVRKLLDFSRGGWLE